MVWVLYILRRKDMMESLKFKQDPDVIQAWKDTQNGSNIIDEEVWKQEDLIGYTDVRTAYNKKVNLREYSRGTMVSVILALTTVATQLMMKYVGYSKTDIFINYGFVLIPAISFMLDMGIGKDAGWRYFNQTASNPNANMTLGWLTVISKFWSPDFFRYSITVLLDLFISNPLLEAITKVINVPKFAKMSFTDRMLSNTSIFVQSIVNLITFNSYTNQTRFNWAYSSETDNPNRINTGALMTICGVASALFLSTKSVVSSKQKTIYCIIMFSLLSFGFQWQVLEPDTSGKVRKIDILQRDVNDIQEQLDEGNEGFTVDEEVKHISAWNGRMKDSNGRVIGTLPNQYYYGWIILLTSIVVGLRLDIPIGKVFGGSTLV